MKCQVSQWPETGHWLFGVFCWGGGGEGCEVSINGCSMWLVTQDTWKCFIHLILQLCLCMSLSGPIMKLLMGLFSFFFPSAHIPSTDYCMDKRLFTNQLSPDERAKHAYFCHKHQDEVGISDLCTPFSHKFTYKSSPCRCIVIRTIWVSLGIATLLIFILYMWCVCLVGEGRWFDCNIATHTHDQTKQKTKKYHLHKVTIVPSSGMY